MTTLTFIRDNAPWLAAATLMTFSSGYGQTYFISLFAGDIKSAYGLSDGDWGLVYMLGTLASALAMLWVGGLTDRFHPRNLSALFLLMLAATCVAMAANTALLLLVVIIFGLRLSGQGMMTHIPTVSIARWFAANRGKALAIGGMGFFIGEAGLPIVFVSLSAALGWRGAWLMAALFAILAIPLIRHLLRSDRVPQSSGTEDVQRGMVGRFWTRNDALKHWSFWLLLLWFALPSTFGTALFFHQVHIAEVKGWPFVYYVALIPFLTGGSIAATFTAGWAVDWLGANRVIALGLLPASLGFLILGEAQHLWVAAMALVVLGLTNGWVSTLGGAIWPELYGTRNIGAIRSIAMSAVVFGSAAGPAITGTLIDQGYMFEDQMPVISVIYLCYSFVIFLAMNRIRPSLMTATGHA